MNQTPFYGESGGQVGDTGEMRRDGVRLAVTDTQKKAGDVFAHAVRVDEGAVKVGDPLLLEVDHARRAAIRQNHSATHILHEALRQVLGDHVAQKGSLVAPDRLRFDFSHPKPMTAAEIGKVEDIANDIVLQNAPVTTRLMALDDARNSGARALFGEKYGDEVRVVAMGEPPSGSLGNTLGWSVELCGGTHVRRTGDIGLIGGLTDSGVAAGVRRIEALTGRAARKSAEHQAQIAKTAAAELKVTLDEMPARLATLLDERKRLERELTEAKKKLALGGGGGTSGKEDFALIQGVKVVAKELSGVKFSDLRGIADDYKKQLGSGVVILSTSADDGKTSLVVGVTSDLTSSNNAVQMVQAGVPAIGGSGGGGRPDMAQGGGTNPGGTEEAFKKIKELIKPPSATLPSG
jgi:alanyl-tRNA synthetase